MDLSALASIASELGALGVSVLVLVAMLTERLVPKGRLDDMRKERDAAHERVDKLVADLESLANVFRQRP